MSDCLAEKTWLQRLESIPTHHIHLGLTRIKKAAQQLGLLTPSCPVITVAGTNGKGSTVGVLEALYAAAGYRVGTYTSPHLMRFHERIRLCQNPVSDNDLNNILAIIFPIIEQQGLTYFEAVTLAALFYFKVQAPDIMILEVGLGGRLDAVNIIDSDLAVITGIDYDHQEHLGTTLHAISFEKAGILRYRKPLFYAGEKPPSALLACAYALKCPIHLNNRDFLLERQERQGRAVYRDAHSALPIPVTNIHPDALSGALAVTSFFSKKFPIPIPVYTSTLTALTIPGRLMLQKGHCDYILDVSHNAQSVLYLSKFVRLQRKYRHIYAVFGVCADKAIIDMIAIMKPYVSHWFPSCLPVTRSASVTQLMEAFSYAGFTELKNVYEQPHLAFEAALQQAQDDDLIVVYGSFYTVEAIMRHLN